MRTFDLSSSIPDPDFCTAIFFAFSTGLAGVGGATLITGGKGGGRPDLGRGKVGDPAKREAAVSMLRNAITETMGHAA